SANQVAHVFTDPIGLCFQIGSELDCLPAEADARYLTRGHALKELVNLSAKCRRDVWIHKNTFLTEEIAILL
ncbi:MAG: hypothetical protein ACKO9Q_02420, partial [Pirellula sp.]